MYCVYPFFDLCKSVIYFWRYLVGAQESREYIAELRINGFLFLVLLLFGFSRQAKVTLIDVIGGLLFQVYDFWLVSDDLELPGDGAVMMKLFFVNVFGVRVVKLGILITQSNLKSFQLPFELGRMASIRQNLGIQLFHVRIFYFLDL